ncbi:MAG: tetratricopeptide repeat protein [Catenulispora sp.]|nr:tetratricopeptide repeat protein [Catenulispora sp.]
MTEVETLADLARVLRELRRRHARAHGDPEPTYRELAAMTGWSHGIIGEYLAGRVLPPTDRFDTLVRLLGARPAEQRALATARDRVEEGRRRTRTASEAEHRPHVAIRGTAEDGRSPRQLPMDVFGFTGRSAQLAELDALLDQGERQALAVISAVAGTAGVGKTALAVRWAHRVADRFPDGQLYIDLRGYDPERPVSPADALARFLRDLGLDGARVPADPDERAACYRTMLAERRVLVVLDNAYGADQVRPLLPGTPTCFVLVTSRDALAGLVARDGARRIALDLLAETEAVALLRTLIGPRVDAELPAAVALAERCARLPLALRITAEFANAQPGLALADLLVDLDDERRRLDLLDMTGDQRTAVRPVFSWSYRRLSEDGARVFGLLALHPGPDADAYATAALADLDLAPARTALDELARAHLIQAAGPGRYSMHDLLRAYAVECATSAVAAEDRDSAQSGLFDYYLHCAATAMNTLFPHERRSRPETLPPKTPVPVLDTPDDAARWLDRERADLVAVADYAAKHGHPHHSIDLSRILWRAFEVGGHHQEALAVHTSAADAARETGRGLASVLTNLGNVHWWLGDHRKAQACFEESLAGHRETGDAEGEARALARLGVVHERLGAYDDALACLQEALAVYRELGDRYSEGAQLINIGTVHRRLGRHPEAAEAQQRAAMLFVEIGDLRLEGYALGNLGELYSLLGRYDEALAHLARALANCRASNDRGGEGSALGTIGMTHLRSKRHAQALEYLRRALDISRETGDRNLETEMLGALGRCLHALGDAEPALSHCRDALALAERTGDRYEQARALDGLARVEADTGRAAQARRNWQKALALYTELGVPDAQQLRRSLGE